jgi:hypothetical protein
MFDKGAFRRLRPSAAARSGRGQGLVLALILSVAFMAAIGLLLVWLNLERTKLAYKARNLQHEVEQARDLNSKLSVEREHLLSPAQLGKKAEALGLGPAKPGQIRRMEPRAGAMRQDEERGE